MTSELERVINGQRQLLCTYCGKWKDVEPYEDVMERSRANIERIKALPDDAPEKRFWKFAEDEEE